MRQRGGIDATPLRPGLLGEVPEGAFDMDETGCGRALAAEHLEHARLAGAVAADEADLLPGADSEGRLDESEASANFHAEAAGLEHALIVAAPRRAPVGFPKCRRRCLLLPEWWP